MNNEMNEIHGFVHLIFAAWAVIRQLQGDIIIFFK